MNTYSYTKNNPINSVDSSGQFAIALPLVFFTGGSQAPWGAITGIAIGITSYVLWSSDNNDCEEDSLEEICKNQYDIDINTCRNVTKRPGKSAGYICYSTAAERFAACLSGRPFPPLDVWNN